MIRIYTKRPCFSRSFEPPKRDEERETERKAKAKKARETRRSTQVCVGWRGEGGVAVGLIWMGAIHIYYIIGCYLLQTHIYTIYNNTVACTVTIRPAICLGNIV